MNVLPVTPAPPAGSGRKAGPATDFVAALAVALDGQVATGDAPAEGEGGDLLASLALSDIVASTADQPRSSTAAAALSAIAAWRAEAAPTTTLGAAVRAAVAQAPPADSAGAPVPAPEEASVPDLAAAPPAEPPTDAPVVAASEVPAPVDLAAAAGLPAGDASATVTNATVAPDASAAAGGGQRPDGVAAAAATDSAAADLSGAPASIHVPETTDESVVDAPRPANRGRVDSPAVTTTADVSADGVEAAAPDAQVSPSTTGEVASNTVRTGAAAVDRVLQALELLENAPPPRRLTFEVDGVRLAVSLAADGVSVDVRGNGTLPSTWRQDLEAVLSARGFELSTGGRDAGDRDRPSPDARPEASRPPTAPPATVSAGRPATADGGIHL